MTPTPKFEDSPDLTDEVIATATDTTLDEAGDLLAKEACPCGASYRRQHTALRRRHPYHYWITKFTCHTCGVARQIVFRLTDKKWRLS